MLFIYLFLTYFLLCLELKSCAPLSTPANGTLRGSDTSHGAKASFSCLTGFDLFGSPILTCSNGVWNAVTPTCKGSIANYLKYYLLLGYKLLYLTFVRSYIGYASEVWAPSTIGSITKIESLQRRATKFILNTLWHEDISYHERLSRLNLLPLAYWHKVKD